MTARLLALAMLACAAGTTLVLSTIPWFARRPIAERLAPYGRRDLHTGRRAALSVESFRDVVAPLARSIGARVSALFGVAEELAVRLERIHSPIDVTTFRVRQTARAALALAVALAAAVVLPIPPALGVLLVLGAPLLVFLVVEQSLARASAAWQQRLFLELPVVAEQLGMLLGSGYSLGAALSRLATRGSGACSSDLRRVTGRIQQGLSEASALREWAEVASVAALDQLVGVLALNREASNLGQLVAEEARSIRREAQRRTIESIERRAQQVWIPVTVATLLPGVVFMAVPFVQALSLFSAA